MIIIGIIFLILALAFIGGRADKEKASYVDHWKTKAQFYDKLGHGACAFGLTLAMALFIPWWLAALTALAAGVVWEWASDAFTHKVARYDLYADAIGVGLAVVLMVLRLSYWPARP